MCFLCLHDVADHVDLHIRRHGDIDHLDRAARPASPDTCRTPSAHAARRLAGACAGVREAIATGLKPALRYATRWQSAMMNPLPMQPIGGDFVLRQPGEVVEGEVQGGPSFKVQGSKSDAATGPKYSILSTEYSFNCSFRCCRLIEVVDLRCGIAGI